MVPVWILLFVLTFVHGHRSIEDDYCEVVEEYKQYKASMDNILASRDRVCKNKYNRIDCASIKDEYPQSADGVYRIQPKDSKSSFQAYCDMTKQGGGWLVIQRRQDGSEDFFRNWFEYMDGFGNLKGEFWLGNEKIHRLTSQGSYTLRIDLEKLGKTAYVEYNHFRIGDMSTFYSLSVSGFSGNTGDALKGHNNTRFSAKNLDLDTYSGSCAHNYHGAWWYTACHNSNLNGLYTGTSTTGMWWSGFSVSKKTTMKIRPAQQ